MKTVNVAVIGAAGWIGSVHAECYARLNTMIPHAKVVLHTAVDVVEENAKKIADQLGFLKYTTDYHDAVNDPEVDIIDICCNNNFHKEIAIQAANAGKHVFCEKPLAMTEADALEMVECVKKNGVVNGCNLVYRKYPGVAFIKNLIDEGKLGKLYYIKALIEQDSHSDPKDMHAWLFNRAKAGGGTIVTNGTHPIDLCRYLMGDYEEVSAISETFIKERPKFDPSQIGMAGSRTFIEKRPDIIEGEMEKVDVDDATAALIKFKNGGIGVLVSTWAKQGTRHNVGFEIVGSKGSAIFNTERLNEVQLYINETDDRTRIGYTTIFLGNEHPYGELINMKSGTGIGGKDVFAFSMKDFVECVLESKEMSPSFYDGYMAVKYLKRIQQAADEHRWVSAE